MHCESGCWRERRSLTPCEAMSPMLLTIPDIRQTNGYNCGEAAVRAVLSYHHFAQDFLGRVKISSPVDGVDPLAVERFLSDRCGLLTMAGSMTVADLRHFANSGRPVICLVHWEGASESHWVVCRGVASRRDVITRIHFHDVESGPKSLLVADWEKAWTASDGRRGHVYRQWGIMAWPP